MNYAFHPDAESEFIDAIDYYENCRKELGFEFAIEVFSAIERACSYPKSWQIIEEEIRRSLVNRFPFGILYSIEKSGILVIAVMHLHQKPDYWKKRI